MKNSIMLFQCGNGAWMVSPFQLVTRSCWLHTKCSNLFLCGQGNSIFSLGASHLGSLPCCSPLLLDCMRRLHPHHVISNFGWFHPSSLLPDHVSSTQSPQTSYYMDRATVFPRWVHLLTHSPLVTVSAILKKSESCELVFSTWQVALFTGFLEFLTQTYVHPLIN
jgi:hypothetical protein